MPSPTFSEALYGLIDPWIFLACSLYYLPGTIARLALAGDFRTFLSPSRLRAAWFGAFWAFAGPGVRQGNEPTVVPLLQGRVHDGKLDPDGGEPPRHPPVSGTVLEIGPGSGMWVDLFSDRYRDGGSSGSAAGKKKPATRQRGQASAPSVTRVFGVEPNRDVHALLRQKIHEADLEGIYEIVPVGIEDLASSGAVQLGSVDCIVSIQCLCSIPEPESNIRELYRYLKPGGRWYAFEHVKCHNHWAMIMYQGKGPFSPHVGHDSTVFHGLYRFLLTWSATAILNIFWPTVIGGCELQRDIGKWLREAGPWSDIDLAYREGDPWFHTLPRVLGILTK
jgi:SAM-dependent methyltransferase